MGREFLGVFEKWADSYDDTITGHDEEYKEVFAHYDDILNTVVQLAEGVVVEFGVGTGNLTAKLVEKGLTVHGVEPSEPMRNQAVQKLGAAAQLVDGDFLAFPVPAEQIDTFVSTYAFHHLTDEEKEKAIAYYSTLLLKGGKIVFADTVWQDEAAFQAILRDALDRQFLNLAEDIQTEYYTTIAALEGMFLRNGFAVQFRPLNKFVWLIEATKTK